MSDAWVHVLVVQTTADLLEAIIGAAYMSGGVSAAYKAARSLRLQMPRAATYQELAQFWEAPPSPFSYPSKMKSAVEAVQKIIGYQFKHVTFLYQALVSVLFLVSSVGYPISMKKTDLDLVGFALFFYRRIPRKTRTLSSNWSSLATPSSILVRLALRLFRLSDNRFFK